MAAIPAAVLHILVTANTGGASASLTRLDRRLKTTATSGEVMGRRVATGAKYAAVGLAAAAGGSVYAAAKFESAFANVRKTVDANEKGFARIRTGLLDLSETIPVSANALAGLAGEAGALGVKQGAIVRFTKTASQLGTTTDLAATDAANALARLANIMDSDGKKAFERMGATLVDLGNKGASTEAEISDMALRIAGAGETIGLTEAQVLGLSAALANVGIRSEMGGSAISRVMLEMQDAIAQGGGELKGFADIAGVTSAQFRQQFGKDAPGAIAAFATGLGEMNKEGDSTIETLKGVDLNEVRVRDTLLRLAGNTKNFTDAQGVANGAWKENSALAAEAQERYDTLESSLRMLGNTVVRSGIDIGDKLIPDIKELVAIMRDPHLTLDDKIAAVGDKLGDMIAEWAPEAAEAGGKIGLSIVRGLGQAFLDSNILGKLVIGGALIRAIGGKGAIAAVGRWMGLTLATETVAASTTGAAASQWENLGKGIGRIVGPAVAAYIAYELMKKGPEFYVDAIKHKTSPAALMVDQLGISQKKAENVQAFIAQDGGPFDSPQDALAAYEDATERTAGKVRKGQENLYDDLARIIDKGMSKNNATAGNGLARLENQFGNTRTKLNDTTAKQAADVAGNAGSMVNAVATALETLRDNTNKAMVAYQAKRIAFSVQKVAERATQSVKRRKGGLVPGTGSGDKVPLHIDGQLAAMVEPREYVSVANRTATEALMAHNSRVPRRADGGLVQALGPYTIPPIQYDPNHAGSNSHLHLSFSSVDIAKAFAQRIQPMGWMASESPWAGGVTVRHSDPGHYTGSAFDANTAADETQAEVAAVARLLGGKLSGASAPAAQKLKRILLEGPDGPLKAMGQGSLDKPWKAAQAFVDSQTPKVTGGFSGVDAPSGSLSKAQLASLWKKVNPGSGNPNLMAAIAMAESMGNPQALNSIGAKGLWQIIPSTAGAFGLNYGKLFDPAYNAFGAGKILQGQGLGAWETYTLGMHQQYLKNGGVLGQVGLPFLGKFHSGGVATREGLAHVAPGEEMVPRDARGTRVEVNVDIRGDITPHKGVSMDDVVRVTTKLISDNEVEIERHNHQMAGMNS